MDGTGWNYFSVCTTYDVCGIYECRGTDIYVHYINYRNSGKLSLGMARFQIRNKELSIVFAFSYVAALVLLITSFNIVCVWLGCVLPDLESEDF